MGYNPIQERSCPDYISRVAKLVSRCRFDKKRMYFQNIKEILKALQDL